MALTLEAEQRLEAVGLVAFFFRRTKLLGRWQLCKLTSSYKQTSQWAPESVVMMLQRDSNRFWR